MASRPWAQAEGAGSGRDLRSGRHWAWDYGTWLLMDMTLAVGADGVWNNIICEREPRDQDSGEDEVRGIRLESLKAKEGPGLHFWNSQ